VQQDKVTPELPIPVPDSAAGQGCSQGGVALGSPFQPPPCPLSPWRTAAATHLYQTSVVEEQGACSRLLLTLPLEVEAAAGHGSSPGPSCSSSCGVALLPLPPPPLLLLQPALLPLPTHDAHAGSYPRFFSPLCAASSPCPCPCVCTMHALLQARRYNQTGGSSAGTGHPVLPLIGWCFQPAAPV
jgi:hypothetical protein